MKKTLLRAVVLLLTFSITLSLLLACKEDDKNEKTTEEITSEALVEETLGEEESEVETEPEYPLGVDKENNDNVEITILIPNYTPIEIGKAPSSERVAQAMYERNCDAEEYLGVLININDEHSGSWSDRAAYNTVIRNDVKVDHTIDIITMSTSNSFLTCAQEGLLANLADIEVFDFDAPWWIPDMIGQYAINGKLYGGYGDMSLGIYADMATIFFNAKIVENYSIENPYKMVQNNEWTLDKMIECAKKVEESIDGEYDPLTNMMGYMAFHTVQRTLLVPLDLELVGRDAETGKFLIPSAPNEKLLNVFNKLFTVFEEENEFFVLTDQTLLNQTFMNSTVLFMYTYLRAVSEFRGMEDDYGLVPAPKHDSSQKQYYTNMGPNSMWTLPSTATPEMNELCAKLTETLGYLGRKNVVPEYYDITLGYTLARDENVKDMLKIMRDGATMRAEFIYGGAFSPGPWGILQMTDESRHPTGSNVDNFHGESLTNYWSRFNYGWKIGVNVLYNKLK